MTERHFARHASDAFNAWMEDAVARLGRDVAAALGENLVALVLGGGYARGEGGVVRSPQGERPYNDLDFTLVVKTRAQHDAQALEPLRHRYEAELGIDVDFSRPLTPEDVRAWPHWLMWTDLLAGHRVIVGPKDVLTANAPAVLRQSPPLIEATRLLLNRGAGLLWALRIRRGFLAPRDPDFVRRNAHKCALALGDALIIVHRRHQTPYEGRDALLEQIEREDPQAAALGLMPGYRAALAFRLEPGAAEPDSHSVGELEALADLWGRVWLRTEEARTGRAFADAAEYSAWDGIREAEQNSPRRWPRNLLRNAQQGRLSLRYPREFLFRELPRLLVTERAGTAALDARAERFLALWGRFN